MFIYQIELTSKCNLSCSYCPHARLKRPKEHMDIKIVEKILDFPFMWDIVGGHHFGEPLLHPDILKVAALCRSKGLGFGFSTNAELLTVELFRKLVDSGLTWLKISFHTAKGRSMYDSLKDLFPDFALFSSDLEVKHDWAGLVNGEGLSPGAGEGDCIFHRYNLGVVSAQGEVLSCCMDAHGVSSIGSIFDFSPAEFLSLKNSIWTSLCKKCFMRENDEALQNDHRFIMEVGRRAQVK